MRYGQMKPTGYSYLDQYLALNGEIPAQTPTPQAGLLASQGPAQSNTSWRGYSGNGSPSLLSDGDSPSSQSMFGGAGGGFGDKALNYGLGIGASALGLGTPYTLARMLGGLDVAKGLRDSSASDALQRKEAGYTGGYWGNGGLLYNPGQWQPNGNSGFGNGTYSGSEINSGSSNPWSNSEASYSFPTSSGGYFGGISTGSNNGGDE